MAQKIALLFPVKDDWTSFFWLCQQLDLLLSKSDFDVTVYAIDDCSNERTSSNTQPQLSNIHSIEIIRLVVNVGHQRAICVGLVELAKQDLYDFIIVADSDGEDVPADFLKLIAAHTENPNAVIVAQREKRSESASFVLFYKIYKLLFQKLTGKLIDFGNFSLIPRKYLKTLSNLPSMWNNFPASVIASKAPIVRVPTARGKRYAGSSTMNFVSLMIHGMSAISVFLDVLLVRLFIGLIGIGAIAALIMLATLGIKLFTNYAIPGWATTVFGITSIILFQALFFAITTIFLILSNRSQALSLPTEFTSKLIEAKTEIYKR